MAEAIGVPGQPQQPTHAQAPTGPRPPGAPSPTPSAQAPTAPRAPGAPPRHEVRERTAAKTAFGQKTADALSKKYHEDVRPMPHSANSRGGCMNAAYQGISVINSPAYSKDLRKRVYREATALDK